MSLHRKRLWSAFGFPRPWFGSVSRATLRDDAIAGMTNAAIVLPQGVAFAVIAGLPPEYGLFTAMITPVIAAIWGSSMIMVSGPTTAISAVLFATLSAHAAPGTPVYVNMALTLTIVAGLFQILSGILRLGGLISFISHSVMIGFTAAAAMLIAASQLGGALGIVTERGGGVFERLERVWAHIGQANGTAFVIAAVSLLSVVVAQKLHRKLPSYLIALCVGAGVGALMGAEEAGVAMFGALPSIVPSLYLPTVTLSQATALLPGAATIAFVGLLEAVSIGRTFAIRRGEVFEANQEFIGQGLSNTVGGVLQCYPGSGSFTRSGLNAESGARTPLSAIFAALFLFALLAILAPFVDRIPVPAMSAIILFVAWRLISFTEIRHIFESGRDETLILGLTFFAAILTELDIGILVGVLTSLIVFLIRSARPHVAALAPAITDGKRHLRGVLHYELEQCPEISLLRIEGPLFFASCEFVEAEFRRFELLFPGHKTKILALKGLGKIDLAAADLLISEMRRARAAKGEFYIVAAHIDVVRALRKLHVIDELGAENLFPTKAGAIAAAVGQVGEDRCKACAARVFLECANKPTPEDVPPEGSPKEIQDVYRRF